MWMLLVVVHVSKIVDESDSKISHWPLQLQQQITTARFWEYYNRGLACWGSIIACSTSTSKLVKKHQMHVVPFCQNSNLSFSNGKATPYPLGKWNMPISTIIKEG